MAREALDAGHSALFVSLRELSQQLDAPAPRGGLAALRRYSQPTLLLIDEIGYTRLNPVQAQALFELVTARYERRSTVLTSNLTFAEWGGLLGDEVLATALLDRLLHHAEVIVTKTIHTLVHHRRSQKRSSSYFPSTRYMAAA
ncbi:MAG: ATP-binding protein [Chloroflexota bacterium]|nr:ATP-binding protein [Chloroflexota bacterium]